MPDYTALLRALKQASGEANRAAGPVQVCFGKVVSEGPLKIQIDQKITLGMAQLILSRHVTDYDMEVTVKEWETKAVSGGSGDAAFASHKHGFDSEKKKVTIHNALVVGDEVILLRQQGGQKYIVVDRMVKE